MDDAASIEEFRRYSSEEEFVWNVLTFLQYLVGKEELVWTPHGLVRMITVKANSNGRILTIEQLASRRKDFHLVSVHQYMAIVAELLDTLRFAEDALDHGSST